MSFSTYAASIVSLNETGGSVTVSNINQWYNCVAKGTQLIDMAYNGSYITFDLQTNTTGNYTFTSAIATTLNNISCVLGYTDANGVYTNADTVAITNNGSWTSTVNYDWVFNLEAGKTYKFKMTCIAGSGFALNAFSIDVTTLIPNVAAKGVKVNGYDILLKNNIYSSESFYGNDLLVNVATSASAAKVSYTAKCNGNDITISSAGLIDKSQFKNGDLVVVTARISNGPTAYADYTVQVQINDFMKKQLLGTTVNEGYWTNLASSSFVKVWTDYIYSVTPNASTLRFYNYSWTPSGSNPVYCFYGNTADLNLTIPTNMEVYSVNLIGFGSGPFSLKSDGATVTALTDTIFSTAATADIPGEILYNIANHTAGKPINIKIGANYSRFYIILRYKLVADVAAPVLVDQNIKNNDILSTKNGIISLRFNEVVKLSSTAKATLNGVDAELSLENNIFIKHYFSGLQYQSSNEFILKANSVEDLYGNKNAQDIVITFNIGNKPAVTKKVYNFIVGVNGNIDQAFAAANAAAGTDRYYIFIPNGRYELSGNGDDHMTSLNRSNVSIIGQSKDSVIVSNTPVSYGISNTATVRLNYAKNTYMEDLTLKNNKGEAGGGQQVVIYDSGSQNIFKNVKIFSFQDTYVSGDRAYWDRCDIYGSTDYICGGGDVYFDHCLLYNRAASGTKITAPATDPALKYGYVFQNCTIQGGHYTLGRPWQGEPRSYFLNTIMNMPPDGTGWDGMSALTTHFYEFNSMNESGNPLDLSGRGNSPSSNNKYTPVLTNDEAKNFTLFKVLGRTDNWMPSDYTVQTAAPVVTLNGTTLNWNADADALCTVIFKNGKYLACTTSTSYTVPENGNYSLQTANQMGGLGEATTINVTISGLESIKSVDVENNNVYDIHGVKLNKMPENKLSIKNGKKYYIKAN